MRVSFTERGWQDYLALRDEDAQAFRKLDGLLKECQRHPFFGTGKPEPLKNNMKGWWSRRINQEHRLVYRIIGSGDAQMIEIAQCRFHY